MNLSKNKNGFLLGEETLKIIIAVIVIVFLIYFLVSIYFLNGDKKNRDDAKATLDRIQKVVANSNSTSEQVKDIVPVGWSLFSFTENIKPNSCLNKNCICICDSISFVDYFNGLQRQANECNKNGICVNILNLQKFNEIPIEKNGGSNTFIEIDKIQNKVVIKKI